MTLLEVKQKIAARVVAWRVALTTLVLTGLVGMASADTALNASISPIIYGVTALFVPLLAVVVAALPVIVTLAVVAFILALLARILGKI